MTHLNTGFFLRFYFITQYNCQIHSCKCPKGYSGSFCEVSGGACARMDHMCKNGKCVDNARYRRGFYCQCNDGFGGINCDYATKTGIFDLYNVSSFFIFFSIYFYIFRRVMHGAIR